ncbi:MAG: hypothetical protein JJ897_15480 [Marinibacterium sp.]|nr:hypothetical protein [Marinibacterium sp.]
MESSLTQRFDIQPALEEAQPEFQSDLGKYGAYRIAWFMVDLPSLITGDGILIAAREAVG